MAETVTRHDADVEFADKQAESLKNGTDQFIDIVPLNPRALYTVGKRALQETGYHVIGDPAAEWADTWRSTVLAMQAHTGIFAAARARDEAQFFLRDNDMHVRATGPTADTTAFNWLNAMWLAMICRERSRINMLAEVPESMLRASGAEYDDFAYQWIKALQLYWRGGDGLIDTLLDAMRGTEPAGLRHWPEEFVLQVLYPPIELFYLLTQRDEEQFGTSLVRALELHRRYWTANDERRMDPAGFIALGPLAITCLATDAKLKVRVRSDYLPACLVSATWVGEFTT